ncbi:MAG: chemotaxis protein CheD [Bryobacterales bacterium]|nr:chemotaxis protein CheD [Bryobacterales bacterium]
MSLQVVGIGDALVSSDPESILVTYALGSCVAIAIHDPVVQVGGLLHFMLPESKGFAGEGTAAPFKYADTGIPMLFHEAYRLGAEKSRMVVCVAGGAQVLDDAGVFNIGRRNLVAMRKILWRAGVMIKSEAVGGAVSRTVRLEVGTGKFWLREPGAGQVETASTAGCSRGGAGWLSGF